MHIGRTVAHAVLIGVSTIAVTFPFAAHADDDTGNTFGVQVAYGHADHHSDKVDKYDLGAVWDPHLTWWPIGGWHFGLVGEAHAVYWHTNGNVNSSLEEFGATPVFRFEKSSGAIRPYAEAGVGVRMLTHARISESYTLSSGFQFADMVGVGVKFGGHQQYQIGYRFQHLSNASIKRPNPGIDFHQVYVQYNFK
ncbi:MAG: acyloxyacyl hydrolase [Janthinobacterium lividum]